MLNIDKFDFQNSTIIKPPQANFDKNDHRKHVNYTRLIIDSRDRDINQYPNPASYVIDLPDDINDVVAAELHVADITLSAPLVNQYNNTITFNINGTDITVTLEPGNYNAGKNLGTAIANVLANTDPTFTGTFDTDTEKFIFTCANVFNLSMQSIERNLARILGFNTVPVVQNINGLYTLKSTYKINTSDNTYIVLQIDNFPVNHSITPIIDKSFAILGPSQDKLCQYSNKPVRKDLNPPIGKLSRLRLKFSDYYGNLYDFQNYDHRLEIVFESYKVLRKYMSYVD